MLVKLSVAICLLLLADSASSYPFSNLQKPTFLELYMEAEQTCFPNSTIWLEMQYEENVNATPSRYVCPFHCLASKLGVVNEGGLNKVAVHYARDYLEFVSEHELELYVFGPNAYPSKDVAFEPYFNVIHDANNLVNESCSAKDEATRDALLTERRDSLKQMLSVPPQDSSVFVPSDVSSPFLESFKEAEQSCSTKYNSSLFSVAWMYINGLKVGEIKKLPVCYGHCVVEKLGFVDENGLNKAYLDLVKLHVKLNPEAEKYAEKIEKAYAIADEVAVKLHSSCIVNYSETADDYFTQYVGELVHQHESYFKEGDHENNVTDRNEI